MIIRTELLAHASIEKALKIEKLLLYLEGKGKSENTLFAVKKNLAILAKKGNLENPQEIELIIARYRKQNKQPASNAYKAKLCDCYQHYCKFYKLEWEKPIYTPEEQSIQPPTDEQCQTLIAGFRGELSLKGTLSIETGLRPCEIMGTKGLKAKDHHPDQRTLTPASAKGCNARPAPKLSEQLNFRLSKWINQKGIQSEEAIFTARVEASNRKGCRRLSISVRDESFRLSGIFFIFLPKLFG